MARSTEQSYSLIREYLQSRKLPATVNDMIEANVTSRPTLFRLLRPESFSDAALFGIKVLNNTKPYFFAYDENLVLEMLEQIEPNTAKAVKKQHDVLKGAAKMVAANSIVLDDIEKAVLRRLSEHRARVDKDETLRKNFETPSAGVPFFYETLEGVKEVVWDDMDKFRTLVLSLFVSSFNTEDNTEGED